MEKEKDIMETVLRGDVTFTRKKQNHYNKVFLATVVLFIAYNTYFGWNMQPENAVEDTLDFIVSVAFIYSGIGMVTIQAVDKLLGEGKVIFTISKRENNETI